MYFDYSATSYPKPESVVKEVAKVIAECGNPGRGGYPIAKTASLYLYNARKEMGGFFGVADCEKIIFTSGATESCNMVIKGHLKAGMNVVYSSFEHNAVYRPLMTMVDNGVTATQVPLSADADKDLDIWGKYIDDKVDLVIVCAGSNVTGRLMDIGAIADMAHRRGAKIMVDFCQYAGFLPINLTKLDVDFAIFAGHKGLLGIMGAGVLYVKDQDSLPPYKEGGTGTNSISPKQPNELPDLLESGTPNLPGIAGMLAGIRYNKSVGIYDLFDHELFLTHRFIDGVKNIDGIQVYGAGCEVLRAPVVSINMEGVECGVLSQYLSEKYGVCTRSGLHCAPLAHKTIGTINSGTVRFSFGYANTPQEIDKALDILNRCRKELD